MLHIRTACAEVSTTSENYCQQDKVNYAVSEREHRVTDVTTLMRMTGCSGMYWAVLDCTWLWWAIMGCTGL